MSEKIRLGWVGCGHITKNVMGPQAAALGDYEMRAFMDVDETRAEEVCKELGGAYHTTDVDRLLNDQELDAVAICTLPDTHAPLGKAFLEAGKHVLVQKPVAMTYDECRELVEAERKSSAKAMGAYCYRLSPLVAAVRETIQQPTLMYARMMVSNVAKSHARYLEIPSLVGGGPMLELACHNVDMLYYLARSRPVKITAVGGNLVHKEVDVIDNFSMMIEFENGASATLLSGDCGGAGARYKWHAEIFGEGVTAIIDGFRRLIFTGKRAEEIEIEYQSGIGLDRDMEVFRDVIQGKIESPAPMSESVVATAMMLKAYESIESGLPASIDLDDYLK